MKKIVITQAGSVDVLKIQEFALPLVKAGEVLIKVHAAGLNFADIMARLGIYQDAPPLPTTVGYEVAGTIEQVGEGVGPQHIGRKVMGLTRFHGQAEFVVIKLENCFDIPADFSFEEAAAIPVNYLTAYVLMTVMGSLQKDQTILIQNAGGGVGLAALQLAQIIQAKTIGTASPGKHPRLLELGMNHVVNYREKGWEKIILQLTNGKGVELIIDPLGSESWKKSYPLLRHTGRLGIFGASEMSQGSFRVLSMLKTVINMPWFHPMSMLEHNRGVFGVNMGHLWHEPEMVNTWMRDLLNLIQEHKLKPIIHKIYKFSQVAEAHLELQDRKNFGKVILIPD
jgi:NADPH:quinone reductase-like Zn-dependent oxidoreductase